jgi:hypothetical protein
MEDSNYSHISRPKSVSRYCPACMEHRVVLENINQCPVCANPLDAPEGESASGMGRTPAIGNNLLSQMLIAAESRRSVRV